MSKEKSTVFQEPLGGKEDTNKSDIAILAQRTSEALRLIAEHQKSISWTQQITYFGFVIVIIMVAGMLLDVWNNKGASINVLSSKIDQQSQDISTLTNAINQK